MKIYLRPINLEDGNYVVKWRNSPSVLSHCFDKIAVTKESNEKFFEENIVTGKYKQFIVERIDEDFGVAAYPIATVYLKDMDNLNHRCELCIFTSDDEEWDTEAQSIAIRLLLEKAFNKYNMHKVYTYVFLGNDDELALMKRSGLCIEVLLKDEAIDACGNYVDVYRMCIFRQDFNM